MTTSTKGTAMNPIYVQGDVMLYPVVPGTPHPATTAPRDSRGRLILALGEVTGHAHAIADTDADLFQDTANAAERWLRAGGAGVTLTHEEHAPITVPPGLYRVVIQREYAGPEGWRYAAD